MVCPPRTVVPLAGLEAFSINAVQTGTFKVLVLLPVQFGGTALSQPPEVSVTPAGGAMVAVLLTLVAANDAVDISHKPIKKKQTLDKTQGLIVMASVEFHDFMCGDKTRRLS